MAERKAATTSSAPTDGLTALEGLLERVVYASQESGWSVVKLAVAGRREPVTAVGNLLGVRPGENLRLSGRWVQDRRYGEQFRVDGYVTVTPATLVGIERYLGSGLVRGIGSVMAERLVEHFGLETLDVIERAPERLCEVAGIGPVRRERIRAAWAEQRAVREVMIFLQAHGVSTAYAARIFRLYRERAIALVRENPYRLAFDVPGIGFTSADRIAANLGFDRTSPRRAEAGVLYVLTGFAEEGHVYYPRPALVEAAAAVLELDQAPIEQALDALAASGHVVVEAIPVPGAADGPAVYLTPLHHAERGAADALAALLATPAAPRPLEVERALAGFEARRGLTFAPAQREAVRAALASKVLVVTGGPGTGKTTLVNGLLDVLERSGRRIALAAPTGRAAKRLTETTGREARTIHRLLEFSPRAMTFARDRAHPLAVDLVVIDEVSMVDTVLFQHLLAALPPACQLVLVGDVDQLPSVGAGSVLREVMGSGRVTVVRLTEIFRQAAASLIVVNAHRVNRGESLLLEPDRPDADLFFIERDTPEDILAVVKSVVARRIPERFGLDPLADVQVLTPMHKGLLGAASLNAELQAVLNPAGAEVTRGSRHFRVGDKVMQLRNDYELDVYNGDIGRIAAVDAVEHEVTVRYDERAVRYDLADLDELALAYACSIHKAQGSEYPSVVIPLHTQHYVMLQRNLLYTALTRARRLVVLVGSRRALAIALRNARVAARYTRLGDRLAAAVASQPGGPKRVR